MSTVSKILAGLNTRQLQAVTAPLEGPLQIIAGPGTGKTKVLTSRVAYVLLHYGVSPQNIIVTTFTKNAAAEMIERLEELVAGSLIDTSKLLIGTFHSICVKVLRKYGTFVGLQSFKIADTKDSKDILKEVYRKQQKPNSRSNERGGSSAKNEIQKIRNKISSMKAKGIRPERFFAEVVERDRARGPKSATLFLANQSFYNYYKAYESRLAALNLLDFDDLLLSTHELLTKYPKLLNYLQHVFVDEFQDTNKIQLELLVQFANNTSKSNVTVVGDPDQSIYAFRDAVVKNFQYMTDYIQNVKIIYLNENYRSTKQVLDLCELIISQDTERLHEKNLKSQLGVSFPPVFKSFVEQDDEIAYIVQDIKLVAASRIFDYSDIAILVRATSQTRKLEEQLIMHRVPYKVNKGTSFWERKEVAAMIDYLRVVASNWDTLAITRTLNFPSRGIGPKTVEKIAEEIESGGTKFAPFAIISENLTDKDDKTVGPKIKKGLQGYCGLIQSARDIISKNIEQIDEEVGEDAISAFAPEEKSLPAAKRKLLYLFDTIYVKSGIRDHFKDDEDALLNIMEVRRDLKEFNELLFETTIPDFLTDDETLDYADVSMMSTQQRQNHNFAPLDYFLESVDLFASSSTKAQSAADAESPDDSAKTKHCLVTISTIHSAKGLEWPIVYVPSLNEGVLPGYFALKESQEKMHDGPINEERRIFYVAVTRAKVMLMISNYRYRSRMDDGQFEKQAEAISRFLTKKVLDKTVDSQQAFASEATLQKLLSIREKRAEEYGDRSTVNLDYTQLVDQYKEFLDRTNETWIRWKKLNQYSSTAFGSSNGPYSDGYDLEGVRYLDGGGGSSYKRNSFRSSSYASNSYKRAKYPGSQSSSPAKGSQPGIITSARALLRGQYPLVSSSSSLNNSKSLSPSEFKSGGKSGLNSFNRIATNMKRNKNGQDSSGGSIGGSNSASQRFLGGITSARDLLKREGSEEEEKGG